MITLLLYITEYLQSKAGRATTYLLYIPTLRAYVYRLSLFYLPHLIIRSNRSNFFLDFSYQVKEITHVCKQV
jgi:hypothetical protein